jgi:hypothetical protein
MVSEGLFKSSIEAFNETLARVAEEGQLPEFLAGMQCWGPDVLLNRFRFADLLDALSKFAEQVPMVAPSLLSKDPSNRALAKFLSCPFPRGTLFYLEPPSQAGLVSSWLDKGHIALAAHVLEVHKVLWRQRESSVPEPRKPVFLSEEQVDALTKQLAGVCRRRLEDGMLMTTLADLAPLRVSWRFGFWDEYCRDLLVRELQDDETLDRFVWYAYDDTIWDGAGFWSTDDQWGSVLLDANWIHGRCRKRMSCDAYDALPEGLKRAYKRAFPS